MRLLVRTSTNREDAYGGCEYAVIELSDEDIKTILEKRELFQMVKAKDNSLYEMTFWGCWVSYYEDVEKLMPFIHDEKWSADNVADNVAEGGILFLKEKERLPEPQRTECDRILINETTFNFTCYPKHTGIRIETETINYNLLLEGEDADDHG